MWPASLAPIIEHIEASHDERPVATGKASWLGWPSSKSPNFLGFLMVGHPRYPRCDVRMGF